MGGSRKIFYLAGSVAGVILIVLLAILLTHKGSGNAASGTPTASTGTGTTGATSATSYTLTAPKKILRMKLSASATEQEFGTASLSKAASNFKSKGYGTPTKMVTAVYYLPGSSEFIEATAFKGFSVVGFDGKFNVTTIINAEAKQMTDPVKENPGPNGGEMVCGIGKSAGSASGSVCVWATTSTFAVTEYIEHDDLAAYSNMPATTLKLRAGMEVPAK
jgi:hypothetical protein